MEANTATSLRESESNRGSLANNKDDARIRDGRITCVLAIGLLIVGYVLDIWTAPSALEAVWAVRAASIIAIAGVLYLTFHKVFIAHYTAITFLSYSVMTVAVVSTIVLAETGEFARDANFAGLILMITGIYTWVHLRLWYTSLLAAGVIVFYSFLMYLSPNDTGGAFPLLAVHQFYLIGAMLIGLISQSIRTRYESENHRLHLALREKVKTSERARERSEFAARHDRLTGLPNRTQLEQRTAELLNNVSQRGNYLALLFLDLDGFKPINDEFGHLVGDDVLKLIARRLENVLRADDIVARLGGDEFVIVVETEEPDRRLAENLAKKIAAAIAEPISLDGKSVQVTASIGIASYPADGDDLISLLAVSDDRMYNAKHDQSSNVVALDSSMRF